MDVQARALGQEGALKCKFFAFKLHIFAIWELRTTLQFHGRKLLGPAPSRCTEHSFRRQGSHHWVWSVLLWMNGEGSYQPEEPDGSQTNIQRPGWNFTTERRVSKGDLVSIYVWSGRITGTWDRRGGHDRRGDPQMT